ncbi:MAG: hypothetical protein IPH35_09040 [Rhodoferax sp.]|nr:hypothetical protein [Rhodoferax sp.]
MTSYPLMREQNVEPNQWTLTFAAVCLTTRYSVGRFVLEFPTELDGRNRSLAISRKKGLKNEFPKLTDQH